MYKRQQNELIQGFILGVKEAVFLLDGEYGVEILQKTNLPHLEIEVDYNDKSYVEYWFFRTEAVKNKFIQYNLHKTRKDRTFDHKIVGEMLGFPPDSCRIFADELYDTSDRIAVSYCGMYYMSYKNSIVNDLHYLLRDRGEFHVSDMTVRFDFLEDDTILQYQASTFFKNFDTILEKIKTKIEQL